MSQDAKIRQLWAETLAAAPDPSATVGVRAAHLQTGMDALPTARLFHTIDGDAAAPPAAATLPGAAPSAAPSTAPSAAPSAAPSTAPSAAASVTDETLAADGAGPSQPPAAFVTDETLVAPTTAPPPVSASLQHARATLAERVDAPVQAQFELLSKVGEGGMGVVWRARQESLGREVAIKMLRGPSDDSLRRSRFVAESVITGQLDHPNVVPVHELGQDGDGNPFLAMKLVQGRSWQQLLHPVTAADREEAARWDLRRHVDVLLQVSNGIAYAHARDIIHRDIKPENVMVGAYGEVMVMDWGIAVHIGATPPADKRLPHRSRVSGPAGTPTYMAPEQAEGRGDRLGVHTDVFLLGATLHEILTERPPHHGSELFEVLLAASRSVELVYDEDVPPALADVCRRAMSRDAEDRYPSAEAFRDAVQLWLDHAESLRLSDEADREVRRLDDQHAVPLEERYAVWARALSRYEQALAMWEDNAAALRGQAGAAVAYAEEALRRRDVGLARAQLAVLEGHAAADPVALSSLRQAVQRASVGWRRLAAGVAMAAVVIAAAWWALAAAGADVAQQVKFGRDHAALHQTLRRAWHAVTTGEPSAALRLVMPPEVAALAHFPSDRDAMHDVRLAGLLALWRDARWEALARHACGDLALHHGEAASAAVRAAATNVERLRAPRHRGAPCQRLVHASGAGAKRAIAAAQQLRGAVSTDAKLVAALFEIGLCGRQRALQLPEAPTRCGDWLVRHLPLAAPATPAVEPPELRDGPLGELVARDSFEAATLWQTLPVVPDARDTHETRWLPTTDGHVLLAEGVELQLRHGRTGHVLARRGLPGRVAMLAPHPIEPNVTLAALLVHGPQHREFVWLQLRADDAGPPPPSGDGVAHYRIGRKAEGIADVVESPSALIDALADEVAVDPGGADSAASLLWLLHQLPERCASPEQALQLNDHHLIPCLSRVAADERVRKRLGRDARVQLRQAAISGSQTYTVLGQVIAASRLDEVGLDVGASRIIERASRHQRRAGANVELAVASSGTPASFLRRRGEVVWQQRGASAEGRRKALTYVRDGLDFALAIEGDAGFSPALHSWLAAHPDDAPAGLAERLPALRAASRQLGPFALIQPWRLHVMDAAYGLAFGGPIMLLALLHWLWLRSRSSRLTALYTRGFRTRRERLAAFLTFPLLRLRHMTWSYLTRHERLLIMIGGLATLVGAIVFIISVSTVHHLETGEATLAMGRLDMPGVRRTLARQLEGFAATAAYRRLESEAAWLRGDLSTARLAARDANAREPSDVRALNNLAVLDEQQRHMRDARAQYAAAAAGRGPGAAVARANLARLAGSPPDLEALAARDRYHADHSGAGARPLWARSALDDVRQVVVPDPRRPETLRRTVAQLFTGRTVISMMRINPDHTVNPRLLRLISVGFASASLLLTLLALVWLPMPVLPRVPPPPSHAGTPLMRLVRASMNVRSRVPHVALLGWLLLLLSMSLPLWGAQSHLGASAVMEQLQMSTHYFDGPTLSNAADLQVASYGAAVSMGCLFAGFLVILHGGILAWRELRE